MTDRAILFAEWFGVGPAAARVCSTLYEAQGAVVPFPALMAAGRQGRNGLNLSIKRLRAAMDPGSIGNVHGRGFYMTEIGLADCHAALRDAFARACEAAAVRASGRNAA
ncbi:MAG TPA: hypothetical protein VD970_01990 [Acetobacteraceae bacterium]|nr:hypothetical protein [Acetobacteraceae bacterium]